MKRFTLNQLSYLSDLPEQTILYWHKKMNIFPDIMPTKDVNFKYNSTHLNRLLNITTLFHFDKKYALELISAYTDDELDLRVNIEMLNNLISKNQNTNVINQLIASCIYYNEERFNLIFNIAIKKLSREEFYEFILYPLIRRIYESLYPNDDKPVQFFYIENLLKQKVYSIIDNYGFIKNKNSTILLYLTKDENNEIGLLFCYLLLLHKGYKVKYIGANQNNKIIKQAITDIQPDALMTFVSSAKNFDSFYEQIEELSDYSENLYILGNDKSLKALKNRSINKIHDIKEFYEIIEHIENKKTES